MDRHLTREGSSGENQWHLVGTSDERRTGITMADYMTYDEIKLAALIQVSSPIMPINT